MKAKFQTENVSEDCGATSVTRVSRRWAPGISNNDINEERDSISHSPKPKAGKYREMIANEPPIMGARTPRAGMQGATSNPAFRAHKQLVESTLRNRTDAVSSKSIKYRTLADMGKRKRYENKTGRYREDK